MHRHANVQRAVMPRVGDVRRLLHMYECDLCGDSNMPVGDLHGGTHVCRIGSDMFAKRNLPTLPNVSKYGHMRDTDMRWLEHVPRIVHLPRSSDLSTTVDL